MGSVFLAERDDLGKSAAIKVLRDAALSPARRERFRLEQRILAQLNDPAIARIYDADTLHDGTPYFVMEYVEGVPVTQYCEDRGAGTRGTALAVQARLSGGPRRSPASHHSSGPEALEHPGHTQRRPEAAGLRDLEVARSTR